MAQVNKTTTLRATTTSTTARPAPPSRPQTSGKRPPADEMATQIFLDKKCGVDESHDKFFGWCSNPKSEKIRGALCEGIGGGVGKCQFEAEFTYPKQRLVDYAYRAFNQTVKTTARPPDNGTTGTIRPTKAPTSNTTPAQPEITRIPTGLHYKHVCMFGNDPNKATIWEGDVKINKTMFERITKTCYQELYGVSGLPLWLIILIILIVLTVLIIAFVVFWRSWLRRRVVGPAPGSKVSTIGSTWTSAPISNASSLTSSFSKVEPRHASSLKASSVSRPSSSRASQRPTARGPPSISGSIRSRTPSVRSDMTRSRSRSNSQSRKGSRKV